MREISLSTSRTINPNEIHNFDLWKVLVVNKDECDVRKIFRFNNEFYLCSVIHANTCGPYKNLKDIINNHLELSFIYCETEPELYHYLINFLENSDV